MIDQVLMTCAAVSTVAMTVGLVAGIGYMVTLILRAILRGD